MEKPDISFSPLAMPLLAGPGSIASVIGIGALLHQPDIGDDAQVVAAIVAVVLLCWVLLANAERLMGFLGVNGANALTKIMGFILLCIGVQLVIEGLSLVKLG